MKTAILKEQEQMSNIGIAPYFNGAATYAEQILVRLYYEQKFCQIIFSFLANELYNEIDLRRSLR
jgi:hypothetical protein